MRLLISALLLQIWPTGYDALNLPSVEDPGFHITIVENSAPLPPNCTTLDLDALSLKKHCLFAVLGTGPGANRATDHGLVLASNEFDANFLLIISADS